MAPQVAALAGLLWSQNPGATNQVVVDRIRATSAPIAGTGALRAWGRINAGAALTGWGPGSTPPTATASPTRTATPTLTTSATVTGTATVTRTATRTPTATATATATPAQVAAPTRVACPSPRPPVKVTTTATGPSSFGVTVRAGAGEVRALDFRELRDASITIGSERDVSSPFVYRPRSFTSELRFSATRPDDGEAWSVSFVVTDDRGTWSTFVGGGPGNRPYGSPAR